MYRFITERPATRAPLVSAPHVGQALYFLLHSAAGASAVAFFSFFCRNPNFCVCPPTPRVVFHRCAGVRAAAGLPARPTGEGKEWGLLRGGRGARQAPGSVRHRPFLQAKKHRMKHSSPFFPRSELPAVGVLSQVRAETINSQRQRRGAEKAQGSGVSCQQLRCCIALCCLVLEPTFTIDHLCSRSRDCPI